jgi:hypothetical protein
MLPAAAPSTSEQSRARPAPRSPAAVLRVVLALGWLALALTTVLVGERSASLADLRAGVASGEVTEVRLSEGLQPGSTGYVTQVAVWREGLLHHRTEGFVVTPGYDAALDSTRVFDGDLADQLRADGVRVLPQDAVSSASSVLGWRVPAWVGLLLFAEWVATLFLLVGGPVPERATRWAWFWLLSGPFGVLAFLLLSGPFPGVPRPRPGARRLTGGWAFLLGLLLGGGHLAGS